MAVCRWQITDGDDNKVVSIVVFLENKKQDSRKYGYRSLRPVVESLIGLSGKEESQLALKSSTR